MRKFNLIISLYFLPVFFFTLAVSPNISGDRIGVVLLSIFLLLVPSANYLAAIPGKRTSSGDIKFSLINFLALLFFMVAIYLGWRISWQFNLSQVLYFIAVIIASKQDRGVFPRINWAIANIIAGILLFITIYLGLNQYGFDNLLRAHIILFASLSTIIIIASLYVARLHKYYRLNKDEIEDLPQVVLRSVKIIMALLGLLLLTYAVFFITTYHWRYAGYFTLALLPAIIIIIGVFKRLSTGHTVKLTAALSWLNILLAICLVIFFIYFFLDSTQVLQAIMGGY